MVDGGHSGWHSKDWKQLFKPKKFKVQQSNFNSNYFSVFVPILASFFLKEIQTSRPARNKTTPITTANR